MATRAYFCLKAATYFISSAIALLILFAPSHCHGQVLKKLMPEQYGLWSKIDLLSISERGGHLSYSLSYPGGKDTLFVIQTTTTKKWVFPQASEGRFHGESLFVCQQGPSRLVVQDLNTGQSIVLEASRYELIQGTANLVIFGKDRGEKSRLTIIDGLSSPLYILEGIKEYKISPDGRKLLYIREDTECSEAGIIDLRSMGSSILSSSAEGSYRSPSWQQNSRSVCYVLDYKLQATPPCILMMDTGSRKAIRVLDMGKVTGPNSRAGMELAISDDGKAVFFSVTDALPLPDDTGKVQVWDSSDGSIYPKRALAERYRNPSLYAWFPKLGRMSKVASDSTHLTMLSGSSRFAVVVHPDGGPNFSRYPKGDFLALDLLKGQSSPIVQEHSLDPGLTSISPGGNQVLYFRDSNWWLYDMENVRRRNLTGAINTEWDNRKEIAPQEAACFGIAGWSSDRKTVLLYDRYDIWCIDLASGIPVRLTAGREVGTTYRLSGDQTALEYRISYSGHATQVVDLDRGLLLESRSRDHAQEVGLWTQGKGIRMITNSGMMSDQSLLSENGYVAYREQSFTVAPNVSIFSPSTYKASRLVATNPQQQNYQWGCSTLISYRSSNGKVLKGALFHPAGFVEGKEYPMVVEIYEKRSKYVNHYCNPSTDNPTGFNIANYTLNGYFVLLPDIQYLHGDPGVSARNCVLAAIDEAAKQYPIDRGRVGLIGHSFGGYETGIILTGTDIFAAAVSGAGVSDPVGYLLTNGDDTLEPQFWRFESQQYRMGRSFYQDKDSYLRNSTIYNADRITTPLLTWSGEDDPTVMPLESIKLYNALRRLGKRNVMLVYPGEHHYLSREENRRDLTLRLQEWFDHFLCEKPAAPWMGKS